MPVFSNTTLHLHPTPLARRVADTLEPMERTRKAFQLINSVLVERTVEEVLPIVKENRDGILQVKANIEERLNKLVAEIREFSARYNSALLGWAPRPCWSRGLPTHPTQHRLPPLAFPVRVLKPGEAEALREKAVKEKGGKK